MKTERKMAYRSKKWFPEFYKLHSPEHTSHRLRVPDAFVAFCNRRLPEKAVLSNDTGKLWHLDVTYIDNGVFFLDGWHKFVRDNCLECGDLLIFQYDGDCEFYFKIIRNSTCEEMESANNGAPYMNSVKLEIEEEDITNEEEEEEATIKKSRGLKRSGGNNRGSKEEIVVEAEEEEDEELGGSKPQAKSP